MEDDLIGSAQPQQSSQLEPELGTAQPQLVFLFAHYCKYASNAGLSGVLAVRTYDLLYDQHQLVHPHPPLGEELGAHHYQGAAHSGPQLPTQGTSRGALGGSEPHFLRLDLHQQGSFPAGLGLLKTVHTTKT